MPELDGTVISLMACLIDHAHEEWGFAFPGHKRMEAWTGRSRWAIDRAIAKAKKLGLFLRVIERRHGDDSEPTIFVLDWKPFFAAYRRQKLVTKRKGACAKSQEGTAKSRRGHRESAVQNQVIDPRIKVPCTSPLGEVHVEDIDNLSECQPTRPTQTKELCSEVGATAEPIAYDDPRTVALERWEQTNGKYY